MNKREAEIEKRRENIKRLRTDLDEMQIHVRAIDNLANLYRAEYDGNVKKRDKMIYDMVNAEKELKEFIVDGEMFEDGNLLALPAEILEKIVGLLDVPSRARFAMCNKRMQKWFKPDGKYAVPHILQRHRNLMERGENPTGFTVVFNGEEGVVKPPEGYDRCVYALEKVFFVKYPSNTEGYTVDFEKNLIAANSGISVGNDEILYTMLSDKETYNNHSGTYEKRHMFSKYGKYDKSMNKRTVSIPGENYNIRKEHITIETIDNNAYVTRSLFSSRLGVKMKKWYHNIINVHHKSTKLGHLKFQNHKFNIVEINDTSYYSYGANKNVAVILTKFRLRDEVCIYKKTVDSGDEYKLIIRDEIRIGNRHVALVDVNKNGIFLIMYNNKPSIWLALR